MHRPTILRNIITCLVITLVFVSWRSQSQAQNTDEGILEEEINPLSSCTWYTLPKPQKINADAARNAPPIARFFKTIEINKKIEETLQSKTKVNFSKIALVDIVKYFRTYHQIEIIIDNKSLSKEKVAINKAVHFASDKMQLESVLKHLLKKFDARYYVANGKLVITSSPQEEEMTEKEISEEEMTYEEMIEKTEEMSTVVYDVRKLRAAGMREWELIRTIKMVDISYWKDGDGEEGTISSLSGALVVYQTYNSHKKILKLLQQIERVVDRKETDATVKKTLPVARFFTTVKANKKIEKVLQCNTSIEINFSKVSLEDVMKDFENRYRIKIVIDEIDLKSKLVNFVSQNVSFESTLKHILRQFNASYYIANESLMITSTEHENEKNIIMVYDIRKLIAAGIGGIELIKTIEIIENGYWKNDDGKNSYLGMSYWKNSYGKMGYWKNSYWKNGREFFYRGGASCCGRGPEITNRSISQLPGCLVISQSYHSHKKVFDLLQQLERLIDITKNKPSPAKLSPKKP